MFTVLYGATTTTKIKKSKQTLSHTASEKKKTSRRLGKIAKDIKSAEKDVVYLENKIDKLARDQVKTEKKYESLKKELKTFEKDFETTSAALEKKRKTFISLLSDQFSIVFAMEQAHEATQESIILHEIYRAYKKQNTKALASLRSDILALKKRKKSKLYLRNKTKKEIASIIKKRDSYAQKKLAKEKLLKKLSVDEEKYNAKLEKLVDKQNSLRSTLAKLNILHTQEVEEAKRRAAAKKEAMRLEKERQRKIRKAKALARAKARKAKEALRKATTEKERVEARLAAKEAEAENKKVYKESDKVRQINSSYTKSQTYKYRGKKTISPLAHARVTKKFGTYIDPIYKIKIFNESITLKSSTPDAKVKNVLNGKVVFAGKSSMLGKVVVVAHSHKMHTVYAGLSKIAPTIHVGSKIKRGYVVGKVSQKLIFQATKNSKHINPLKLIKI
ncbi:MAG: peptidoglycan DD-metalloendopeptidase family protein [Epsilonproteobacteria bacterium]|nr:peptidoglycan DD-metalloendopeptidase family protein [Campylobacterota bacterium]